ncbi:MAG: OprO/OprP family phosphate-selective porin [Bacteroidales bacterium]|jgi:phosphate-selective porin OprO/OprP|nr:OprO/OprP family phosphate-selective porin [Bacteroidales bacterium]
MKRIILFLVVVTIFAATGFAQEATTQKDQYGITVTSKPVSVFEEDGILVFRGDKYRIWLDTRIQADFSGYFGENPDFDKIGDGASIRRARFAVKAQITPDWYGEIDIDAADGVFELKDAIIRYTGVKNLEIQAGNFKENFSISRNTTSRYLQFMERPMVVQALTPSRFIGLNVKYSVPVFWASAGIAFQEIAGSEERIYVEDNNKDYGRGSGLSYTGKIVVRPLYQMSDASLHIGGAISYRNPKSSVSTGDYGSTRFSTRNSTTVNRKKYLDTDLIRDTKFDLLYTVELAGHYKGLRYEGAYIWDNVFIKEDSQYNTETKLMQGWYFQAGYLLLGGTQSYDVGGAKYSKISGGRKWGDIELCLRYEFIDLNDFEGGVYGGSAEAYTAGINVYFGKNFKFAVNYQYNNNDRYANGRGKLFVGYDADGNPTKDYTKVVAADGKAGVDYHMLSCRFQVAF